MSEEKTNGFDALELSEPVRAAIDKIGYEQPSPIQSQAIPHLLKGSDLLGVAQTGTGKTAAFALPLLSRIDLKQAKPQVLILAPTRELAIQVSEAFQRYASEMKGLHVLPIYGGQEYGGQLRRLRRGVHVVVGTPGRVMDHIRRESLQLDALKTLVLDEADEMLRMGFLDDVEWILQHIPKERQTALFSATMPPPIRKVAATYLTNPQEVRIQSDTATVENIEQRSCLVHSYDKLDALTRILETMEFDAILIFVRTKTATVELTDRMEARGFSATALNGDMNQNARERTISQLKAGKLDVVIATDVAARGIDVSRISHVINLDIPYDPEAYIHRIGRTGRAGRSGMAITFVTPREIRLLRTIERATRSPIKPIDVPGRDQLAARRIKDFKQQMKDVMSTQKDLSFFKKVITDFSTEHECPIEDAAAALVYQLQRNRPLQPPPDREPPRAPRPPRPQQPRHQRPQQGGRERGREGGQRPHIGSGNLERYRIEVGQEHGVNPGHIVGAIANEAGLNSSQIGRIQLFGQFSTVELPKGMPGDLLQHLRKVRIFNRMLSMQRDQGGGGGSPAPERPDRAERPARPPFKRKDKARKPDFPKTPKKAKTTKPPKKSKPSPSKD
jgi:ATP-dependent RNA helicase DeaD